MAEPVHLLDVSVLLAVADQNHAFHASAIEWFSQAGLQFALCSFSEAGFMRLSMNLAVMPLPWTAPEAVEFLESLAHHPSYRFWPMSEDWHTHSSAPRQHPGAQSDSRRILAWPGSAPQRRAGHHR